MPLVHIDLTFINKILRFPVQSHEELIALKKNLTLELEALDIQSFECVMLHYAPSVNEYINSDFLNSLKSDGIANKVGVSVDKVDEYDLLSSRFTFDCIQLPYNALNQKFVPESFLKSLKDDGIEIHTRSAFLQGALISDISLLPDYLSDLRPLVEAFQNDMDNIGLTPLEGALAFVLSQPSINSIVLGVQNANQFDQIYKAFSKVRDLENELVIDWKKFATDREELVSPFLWSEMEKEYNAISA